MPILYSTNWQKKGTIQFDSQAKEMKSRTNRFKVNKNISVEPSLKGEWSSMQYRVTLIQNHVPGLHGDIIGFTVVSVDLNRPWLIHVLSQMYGETWEER